MQIAKSVNSENANISATRVLAQASTFMLLMCLWEISRVAYLYLKFPSGRKFHLSLYREFLGNGVEGELSNRSTSRQKSALEPPVPTCWLSNLLGGNQRCHLLNWVLKAEQEESARHWRQKTPVWGNNWYRSIALVGSYQVNQETRYVITYSLPVYLNLAFRSWQSSRETTSSLDMLS